MKRQRSEIRSQRSDGINTMLECWDAGIRDNAGMLE